MSSFPPPPAAAITTAAARSSSSSTSSSIIIVIIIIASAIIVSVCIYLLLQLLSRKFHRSFRTHSDVVLFSDHHHHHSDSSNNNNHNNNNNNNDDDDDQLLLLTSLPLFTFSSLGNLTTADCAVCLSKFHPHDQLRLLPLCCHAFHSDCIDSWILSNRTCPLCRSLAFPSEADVVDKIRNNNTTDGNSFRIEIGSVSQRRIVNTEEEQVEEEEESNSRSYSIGGSFEYIVDENEYEVSVGSVSRRMGDKEPSARGVQPPGEDLAAEVAGGGSGRNWLRDYIDRASSSFRGSSGRFFTGSSRRNDTDLEANQRAGEEITEYFRWFSGY